MKEYERNVKKGINPSIPCNYYPDDNPDKEPTAYQNHRQAQNFAHNENSSTELLSARCLVC
jgi:homoserine O-succinyltransferase